MNDVNKNLLRTEINVAFVVVYQQYTGVSMQMFLSTIHYTTENKTLSFNQDANILQNNSFNFLSLLRVDLQYY